MKISTDTALAKLAQSSKLFLELFQQGDIRMEIYKLVKKDLQRPHEKDQVYKYFPAPANFPPGLFFTVSRAEKQKK